MPHSNIIKKSTILFKLISLRLFPLERQASLVFIHFVTSNQWLS